MEGFDHHPHNRRTVGGLFLAMRGGYKGRNTQKQCCVTRRVHVPIQYVLWPYMNYIRTTLRPQYIQCMHMDTLYICYRVPSQGFGLRVLKYECMCVCVCARLCSRRAGLIAGVKQYACSYEPCERHERFSFSLVCIPLQCLLDPILPPLCFNMKPRMA